MNSIDFSNFSFQSFALYILHIIFFEFLFFKFNVTSLISAFASGLHKLTSKLIQVAIIIFLYLLFSLVLSVSNLSIIMLW